MQINKGLQLYTDDPYYDLFEGGYLLPLKICVDSTEAEQVISAVEKIKEFLKSCEENIEGFYL